jgi:hypothetical protein
MEHKNVNIFSTNGNSYFANNQLFLVLVVLALVRTCSCTSICTGVRILLVTQRPDEARNLEIITAIPIHRQKATAIPNFPPYPNNRINLHRYPNFSLGLLLYPNLLVTYFFKKLDLFFVTVTSLLPVIMTIFILRQMHKINLIFW